ncbi:hypothetical protein RRG08_020352 [Elysia crispata]|uniref:Uncharacterized protein n=1 Tax=Elysia crispata TaxID=231223 RepID=A0AAE1AE78_9GAST|nr:hypothetical protein RRG08_020352 [Elysia crispata]
MGCSISKSANTGASGSIQAHNKKDGGAGGGGANYPKQQMKPTATITPQNVIVSSRNHDKSKFSVCGPLVLSIQCYQQYR